MLFRSEKYGDAEFDRAMKKYGVRRLFLHARSLGFSLAGLDEQLPDYNFTAPLGDELEAVLNALPKN